MSSSGGRGKKGGGEEKVRKMEEEEEEEEEEELTKNLKDGERIVGPTRRPDGTFRKPIRIRAGYVPQDEVAIYQSKGALWRKEMSSQVLPPGYDPQDLEVNKSTKSRSSKRNEKKKLDKLLLQQQQQQQEDMVRNELEKGQVSAVENNGEDSGRGAESVKSLTSQINDLALSANTNAASSPSDSTEDSNPKGPVPDIDKKIRALKKKIRLAEAQLQKCSVQDMKPEQLEKFKKIEGWHEELKLLEEKKAELPAL